MSDRTSRIKELLIKLKNRGLGDIFISSVFAELVSFIIFVFIVRMFSKEDYGYYAIAYNIYGYILVFIGLGLNNGILQYCSEVRPDEEKEAIYVFARRVGNLFDLALLVLMPIASLLLFDGQTRIYFILMSGWPIVMYLSSYYLMQLRVLRDNRHFMYSNVFSALLFLVSVVPLAYLCGIKGYIIAFYIRYISSAIISFCFLSRGNTCRRVGVLSKNLKTEIIKYSIVCCLTNFVSQILMLVDVTCINIFVGDPELVATYKAATQIPVALLFIPSSVMVFAFPYLAENNKNYIWLKKYSKKLLLGVCALNAVIGILVFAFAPFIVKILWGERYIDAVPILRVLTVNFVITGTFNQVYGNIMVALKKVNINLIKTLICSCLNVGLDILMIEYYGVNGVAYATVMVSIISSTFAVLYFVYWVKKQKRIKIS